MVWCITDPHKNKSKMVGMGNIYRWHFTSINKRQEMKHLTLLLSLLFTFNVTARVIYKTIPGTPYKDITEPVLVIENNTIYKPIPGTNMKDITEPVMIIDKGNIYPTLPGTNLRDYSVTPQFVIE